MFSPSSSAGFRKVEVVCSTFNLGLAREKKQLTSKVKNQKKPKKQFLK